MNPAPLPQPAPFTCPNCGASLSEKPAVCPQCGALLNEKIERARLAPLAAVFLVLGCLVFGAMGACGATLSIAALQNQQDYLSGAFLMFALPSFVVGLVGFVLCVRPFFRRKG